MSVRANASDDDAPHAQSPCAPAHRLVGHAFVFGTESGRVEEIVQNEPDDLSRHRKLSRRLHLRRDRLRLTGRTSP